MASGTIKTLKNALLAILGGAAASGLLVADAAAKVVTVREEDESPPLLLAPPQWDASELLAHRSHSSHRSHRSHSSGSSHYSGRSYYPSSGGSSYTPKPMPTPKPAPPKPGKVSLLALPGGSIFVDGKAVGRDETSVLTLKPGNHVVRVENRFLGDHETEITISAGQSGTVKIVW